MKVKVGFDFDTHGTIENTPKGLVLTGNKKILSRLVSDMQRDFDDEKFVKELPLRLRGRAWAQEVDSSEDE